MAAILKFARPRLNALQGLSWLPNSLIIFLGFLMGLHGWMTSFPSKRVFSIIRMKVGMQSPVKHLKEGDSL